MKTPLSNTSNEMLGGLSAGGGGPGNSTGCTSFGWTHVSRVGFPGAGWQSQPRAVRSAGDRLAACAASCEAEALTESAVGRAAAGSDDGAVGA
ncbi:MAG: hypothetical protein AB7Q16_07455 [Vicinamibacterales bacterium]